MAQNSDFGDEISSAGSYFSNECLQLTSTLIITGGLMKTSGCIHTYGWGWISENGNPFQLLFSSITYTQTQLWFKHTLRPLPKQINLCISLWTLCLHVATLKKVLFGIERIVCLIILIAGCVERVLVCFNNIISYIYINVTIFLVINFLIVFIIILTIDSARDK